MLKLLLLGDYTYDLFTATGWYEDDLIVQLLLSFRIVAILALGILIACHIRKHKETKK